MEASKQTGEYENTKMICTLSYKEVGKKIVLLAGEATLSLGVRNKDKFEYYLSIINNDFEESQETWERLNFEITNDAHFKKYTATDGKVCLLFQRKMVFYIAEFLIDEDNDKNMKPFFDTLSLFITSNDFQIDLSKAEKEETKDSFIMDYSTIEDINQFIEENYKSFKVNDEVDDLVAKIDSVKLATQKFSDVFPKAELVSSPVKGKIYKYNKEEDHLDQVSDSALSKIYKVDSFTYYLSVEEEDLSLITFTKVNSDTSIFFNIDDNSFMFLSNPTSSKNSNDITAYNIILNSKDDLMSLKKIITKCQSENNYLMPYEELDQCQREWIEKENEPDEEDSESKGTSSGNIDFDANYDETSEEEVKNKITAQAYLHDRTFVIKDDSSIAVYKTDEDNEKLTHLMNLPSVATYNDSNIALNGAQLYNSDTNMLLLDRNNPNSLWQYDISTGKIVEEWKAPELSEIVSVAPETKFSQMTNSSIIHGINNKSIFTMDSRVNKANKVVDIKSYKTNPQLSCIATTNFGGIAIGSKDGNIRLYKDVGKRAKSLVSGFGDPIRAIDTTADGSYVLATCDKYLLVITTTCKGSSNGFVDQLGKEKKSTKTLKIKPVDIAKYGLEKEVFTAARFNICKDDAESNITTSLGEYIVVWNFNKVKKGIVDQYKMKKVNQFVIGNIFKYNKDQVVVTMPNKLRLQSQKKY